MSKKKGGKRTVPLGRYGHLPTGYAPSWNCYSSPVGEGRGREILLSSNTGWVTTHQHGGKFSALTNKGACLPVLREPCTCTLPPFWRSGRGQSLGEKGRISNPAQPNSGTTCHALPNRGRGGDGGTTSRNPNPHERDRPLLAVFSSGASRDVNLERPLRQESKTKERGGGN